ncbi:MAG: LrgB family protein [Candidatus Limisoma sp.]|nr:LrgB family protein [Muribaculaceae bacterium]MDD6869675.1 LrgB family protein [bacterium]MDY5827517.1 LrgB family protein [Candidatus Limisoma sp.]
MDFISNPYFLLALTFVIYESAYLIQRRTQFALFNPILVTIALIIVFLTMNDISYDTYNQYGKYIEFWLKPAVVALAIPLYKQLSTVKKQLLPIILSALGGCISGIISVVLVADVCGASREIVMSLAAKSVTTPIAMEVTSTLGGIPSLTAAVVVSVGIFGGIVGFSVMRTTKVHSPMAQGLALGAAAHAVGTSRAICVSDRYGAFASLGLTLNGIFTAILTPSILHLMGY